MGLLFSSTKKKGNEEMEVVAKNAKDLAFTAPVVVFSKTYCVYCKRVKQLLTQLGASFNVIELDVESDGKSIQQDLTEWTGQRTVPNVFIGGKHVGGCDSVLDKHQKGELLPLLNDSGAIANKSAQL